MKFTFKNLGPINNASLELGDLTIIAGLNNTGKSYIAYAIYGFLQDFAERKRQGLPNWLNDGYLSARASASGNNIIELLLDGLPVFIPTTTDDLNSDKINLVKQISSAFSHLKLDDLFNDNTDSFEDTTVDVLAHTEHLPYKSRSFSLRSGQTFSFTHGTNMLRIVLEQREIIDNDASKLNDYTLVRTWLNYMYLQFLLQHDFLRAFEVRCFTSVRPAISLFYKELESSRRATIRQFQQDDETMVDSQGKVWIPAERISKTSRYVLPINDEIDFVKSVPDDDHSPKDHGGLKELRQIEKMLKGHYEKHKDEFYFIPSNKEMRRPRIPLHLASSSVAELSNLYFHFRNPNGRYDQLLIIDEPESHLDTANQIQLARLLARLVNSGVKVLITTHSDYIVKEINNLIMLSNDFDNKDQVVKEFDYHENYFLHPKRVKAYTAENGTLTPCMPDEFGVKMDVFDETINSINRASTKIATRIFMSQEENEG